MPGNYAAELAFVDAQIDEMEKLAVTAGVGRLIGAGIGAGLGGTVGYMRAPQEQKLQGALKGGLLGGAVGLAGGQAATRAGRTQALQFGQRQLHGATGYLPGRGITGTKGVPLSGEERIKALKGMGWTGLDSPAPKAGWITRQVGKLGKPGKRAEKFLTGQKAKALAARQEQARLGETSLPGLAKGYLTQPLQTAGRSLRAPGIAMGVGLPLAFAAPGVVESVQQRDIRPAARAIAETAGYSLGGGLPMLAALGVGSGASALTGRVFGPRGPDPNRTLSGRVGAVQRAAQPLGQVVR